jgi:predicted O-methyltransferase YrrM
MRELKVHVKYAKSFKLWLLPRTKACSSLLFPGGSSLFRVLSSVSGLLYPHEAAFLYRMARYAPGDEPMVEIGSMQGLSTLCFAMGLKKRNHATKIIAVDPHLYGTEAILRHNLSQFQVQRA